MNDRPRIVVPRAISEAIGAFNLDRESTLRLLAAPHETLRKLPREAQKKRAAGNDRYFVVRFEVDFVDSSDLFAVAIDDVTSPEHWILTAIRHFPKQH